MSFKQVENSRDPWQRAFSQDMGEINEVKVLEDMKKDKVFASVYDSYQKWMNNSKRVNADRLNKVIEEDDEFLDNMNVSYMDALNKLANKDCYTLAKLYSDLNRYRQAETSQELHLKHELRSLANGGVKFHPYL